MFHKVYNIISAGIFLILGLFLYLSGNVSPIYYFIAIGIYMFIYLLLNAIRKENLKVLFLMPLVGALTALGILNLTMMTVAAIDTIQLNHDTAVYAKEVKSSASSYKQIFEDETYLYYIDRNFSNLIQISKTDNTFMITYPIRSASQVSNDFSVFSPFYDLSTVKGITKTCNYTLHFALLKNGEENSLLLRIVDGESIYFTYILPDGISDFMNNVSAFEYLSTEGTIDIYVAKVSASADLKDIYSSETEIDAVQNEPAIIVVSDDFYYYGNAMYVEYENVPDYTTRINTFYNRSTIEKIEGYKNSLNNPEIDDEEKETINSTIETLSSTLEDYYVELVNEKIVYNDSNNLYTIRFYRTYNPKDSEDTNPDFDMITAIEWYVDGTFLIGTTNFSATLFIPETLY